MCSCWDENPKFRPEFIDIVKYIEDMMDETDKQVSYTNLNKCQSF